MNFYFVFFSVQKPHFNIVWLSSLLYDVSSASQKSENLQKSEIWYDYKWKNGPKQFFLNISLFSLFSFDSRWDSMLNKITILFHLTMEWDNILRSSGRGLPGRAAELLSIVFHLTTLFFLSNFLLYRVELQTFGWLMTFPSVRAQNVFNSFAQQLFFTALESCSILGRESSVRNKKANEARVECIRP